MAPKAREGRGDSHTKGAESTADLWECRMYKARVLGNTLDSNGGSDQASVKQLLSTLKDGRTRLEGSLRRTALQALVPAAAVGHRGALLAQSKALMDRNKVVRECALESLWEAAGNKRPEQGGAVHTALLEVLPPPSAAYDFQVRRAGARALARLAPSGDQDLLATAKGWLDDEDAQVRASAAKAVGIIGKGLDDVAAVAGRLEDPNWHVSRAAIGALERLSGVDKRAERQRYVRPMSADDGGEEDAEQSLLGASGSMPSLSKDKTQKPKTKTGARRNSAAGSELESSAGAARLNSSTGSKSSSSGPAAKAKGKKGKEVVDQEPPSAAHLFATTALMNCCASGGPDSGFWLRGVPRADAVAALGRIAPYGAPGSLEAVALRLGDVDAEVRHQAIGALSALAPGDHELALRVSAEQLGEYDWRSRAAATEALCVIAKRGGDKEAMHLAAAQLAGPDWAGRRGACGAIRLLQEHSPVEFVAHALHAVAPQLKHQHWSVRRKACEAVSAIGQVVGGHAKVLAVLKGLLHDPDETVRLAVAAALPGAAPQKSKEAVKMAIRMARDDKDVEVCLCALAAIEQLCSKERSHTREAVKEVGKLFGNKHEEVRLAALHTMMSIGEGRRTAIDVCAQILKHDNHEARMIAAQAFKGVAVGRSDRATKKTRKLLRSTDPGIREATMHAVTAFSGGQDPAVLAAAAAAVARFRGSRFQGPAGNALSPEEQRKIAQLKQPKDLPSSKEEIEISELSIPRSPAKKITSNKKQVELDSASSANGGTDGSDASDDDDKGSSHTFSSHAGSKQSSLVSPSKGKMTRREMDAMKAELNRERSKIESIRKQKEKEIEKAMTSSDEEELSESDTDDDEPKKRDPLIEVQQLLQQKPP